MSDTEDLFEWGAARARAGDPDTSHEAARKVNGSKLLRLVLSVMALEPERGMTSEDVADATGKALGSITPRMKPLRDAGYIERLEERRTGASNSPRYVERITAKGLAVQAMWSAEAVERP